MKQNGVVNLRTILAAMLGVWLGYVTAQKSSNLLEAGILVLVGGAILNPILVCFLTGRFWMLIAIIPVISSVITRLVILYDHQHKYEGVELTAFLQKYVSFNAMLGMVVLGVPALLTAAAFHYYKSRRSNGAAGEL